jgi:rhodanese-related sulfurtransferase
MIKQIPSKNIEEFIKNNPNSILLDVRTEEEWKADGKPDGNKIGLKTFFLTIQFADGSFNQNFLQDFEKLNIDKKNEVLTMCMGGVRSQAAAEILSKKDYSCCNILDGFLGNGQELGWKKNKLPNI